MARNDIIPRAVRYAVKDVLSKSHSKAQILELFATEDFEPPDDYGELRFETPATTVDALYRGIDFASRADASRFVRVVSRLLEDLQHAQKSAKWGDEAADVRHDRVERALQDAGIEQGADGMWSLPGGLEAPPLPTEEMLSRVRLDMERATRPDAEPEEQIGAAKEAVEGAIKYALGFFGEPYTTRDTLPDLAARLHDRLETQLAAIAPTPKGAKAIMAMLRALPQGLAPLRNEYGTGHGHPARTGIGDRHGDFAARVGVAYARFILDTLDNPSEPWQR